MGAGDAAPRALLQKYTHLEEAFEGMHQPPGLLLSLAEPLELMFTMFPAAQSRHWTWRKK